MAALTPTQTIRQLLADKEAGIRSGTESIQALLEELRRQVIGQLGQAAVGSWDQYQLRRMLVTIESQIANFSEKAKKEAAGVLEDIWGMGQNLVDLPLQQAGLYMGLHLSTSSLDVLKDFVAHKVDDVSSLAWSRIRGELTLGVMGGKTPQEVAAAIGKDLRSKSIFGSIAERAEVITQTEMGRAFSQAAHYRMYQASQYVPELEKQWLHRGHPKQPRPAHLRAHGQHVPVKVPFVVGGLKMMYPRDPAAPISEVIRCG